METNWAINLVVVTLSAKCFAVGIIFLFLLFEHKMMIMSMMMMIMNILNKSDSSSLSYHPTTSRVMQQKKLKQSKSEHNID